jgi:hypothetical protein
VTTPDILPVYGLASSGHARTPVGSDLQAAANLETGDDDHGRSAPGGPNRALISSNAAYVGNRMMRLDGNATARATLVHDAAVARDPKLRKGGYVASVLKACGNAEHNSGSVPARRIEKLGRCEADLPGNWRS